MYSFVEWLVPLAIMFLRLIHNVEWSAAFSVFTAVEYPGYEPCRALEMCAAFGYGR